MRDEDGNQKRNTQDINVFRLFDRDTSLSFFSNLGILLKKDILHEIMSKKHHVSL